MENVFIPGSIPLLSVVVALPLIAAVLICLPGIRHAARQFALAFSLVELALVGATAAYFDWSQPAVYQLAESYNWIPMLGITWSLAVNALGLIMLLLLAALVPLVIVAGWKQDEDTPSGYLAMMLTLESFMVAIFAAYDVVLFYIAFEAMLIPLYFMIGRYGIGSAEARAKASMKFLLFSLAGGLSMLGGLAFIWTGLGQHPENFFRYDFMTQFISGADLTAQMVVFVSFMIAFAIKAPMVPVHTWLPDTAAVARPGTSTLLVGVGDKIGTFGMIALVLPFVPQASAHAAVVMCVLAIVSILWGALAAIGQDDMMRLVSYTSVSHFGFMILGIFVGSSIAFTGAMVYMVAHGVSIAAMFLISGFLTERGANRDMRTYGGMQRVTPLLAGTWLVAGLASVALPGLSGFVPEYLVLMGTWSAKPAFAAFAVLGVVLAAVYLLLPYQRVFTGQPSPQRQGLADLNCREKVVVAPLLIAMIVLGVWAAPLVSSLTPIADEGTALLTSGAQTEGMAH